MDASLDLSRWTEKPHGVAYRRWVIVSMGFRQVFRTRLFRIMLSIAWAAGAAIALVAFGFSESIADGGWMQRLATQMGPRLQALSSVIGAFVLMYPDVCIGGMYTLLFWLHSFLGLWLSLFALTALVPRLITQDRASNALVIYLARPLTSADYLLGKLGTIVGVLAAMWAGPLLFGWLLSMALAPNIDFVMYSLAPLGRALLFNLIALVTLAAIALGVSSVVRTSRQAILLWVGLWVILGFVASPPRAPVWLQRASFTRNLNEVRSGLLQPDNALITAGESLPITDRQFAEFLKRTGTRTQSTDFPGALASLGAFVALSSIVFMRRLRPE